MVVDERRGLAGVHKRSEEISSQRVGTGLRKFTAEFRWDGSKPPAENALALRILGDDIMIPTKMHRGVPLPENKFFFGVCRHAYPIEADFCYVCDVKAKEFEGDNKAKKRVGLIPTDVAVALAVQMETVTKGRAFAGYKVKMVEFEIPAITEAEKKGEQTAEAKEYRVLLDKLGPPGTKVSVPNIGLMVGTLSGQQALFDHAVKHDTVSDRVFEISRHGNKLETSWVWDHDGADRDQPDPSDILKSYQNKYPFEMPEEWVQRMAAEERYNFFFKLSAATTGADSGEEAAASPDDDGGVEPVADSRAALMARLAGKGNN